MRRTVLPAAVIALALTACQGGTGGESPAPAPTPNVGVQLFQYNWNSVAKQCKEQLGPNHIAFVLLSPAQEHIEGEQWWTSYQPVSYKIQSKLGTRNEFASMVQQCQEAGVKVIADAVINHMAGVDSGTGVAGTKFSHYSYPGLYDEQDFHHCGLTENDDIVHYSNQAEVQDCELQNLADLDTSSLKVRGQLASYLTDLLTLGVDGFRIDAAKHMSASDLAWILKRVEGEPIIMQEVIRGSGEPIQPEDYLENGSVFAFQWSRDIGGIVKGGSLRLAMDLVDGQVPSQQAYTFVTNHDTERGNQNLSYKDGSEFALAEMLSMAVPYGTPILYSGYAFTDHDAGAPQTDGKVSDAVCATGEEPADGEFVCIQPSLLKLAAWRAQVGEAAVANQAWDGEVLSFDRGDRGLIALSSKESESKTVEITTRLPDGTYCEVLTGECTIEVSGGKTQLTVPAMGAVATDVSQRVQG